MKKTLLTITALFGFAGIASAEPATLDAVADVKFIVDNLWILISAALVFVMHLGFSALESGLCQKKNVVNVLFKNVFIICMGILTYYFTGFNTHYPGFADDAAGIFSLGGAAGYDVADAAANETKAYADYTYWADFIFQAMFAATAATIVSGAVAERVKLLPFMIYATLLVGLAYPIAGSRWIYSSSRFWWICGSCSSNSSWCS